MVQTTTQNNTGAGASSSSTTLPASASVISLGSAGKILCLADIRGDFEKLNEYVEETGACAVIHTGDLGFMDGDSPARMAPRILRHVLSYTPLIPSNRRAEILSHPHGPDLFSILHPQPSLPSTFILSQLGRLLTGQLKLKVPVFCVYGPVEDVVVLEKFRTGEYEVENLMVLDEACTRLIELGGLKLRLLGLGGAIMMHKIFDNGDATGTIAGGNGTVWATALQIGELVDTAQRVFDPTETRLLVTHGPMGKEGLLSQLALALKADLTISGSLHFRFIASFNEFGVNGDAESFRQKLIKSKLAFMEVYESARPQLEKLLQSDQQHFLALALEVAQKIPTFDGLGEEDQMWKNCWNWNLSEAMYGKLVLDIKDGRVSAEILSQGLNFGYRSGRKAGQPAGQTVSRPPTSGITTSIAPTHTPPPPGLANQAQSQAKAPMRKPIVPVPSSVIPKSIATSPIGSKFSGNLNQQNRFPAGPIPHPAAPHQKPVQQPQSIAEPASAPAPANGPKVNGALPSKPPAAQVDRQQPQRREVNGSGPAPATRLDPRHAKPVPTQPAAMSSTSTVAPPAATSASSANAPESEGNQDSVGRKAGKGKNQREPKQNGNAGPGQAVPQQQKVKENGVSASSQQGSKEKTQASKAEPAETSATDPIKTEGGEASGSGSSEVVTKLPEPAARTFQARNPNTLYVKNLPQVFTEEDLRALWDEEERKKITKIKIPSDGVRSKGFAYIEFANEEDMQAALAKHGQDVKGQTPNISVSSPPSGFGGVRGGRGGPNGGPGGFRGGGRGGRGGAQQRGGGPKSEWRAGSNNAAPPAGNNASDTSAKPAPAANSAPAPSGQVLNESW